MDCVTTTEKIRRLWMEDRGRLTELAFALECLNCLNEIDTKDTHKDFFELFQSLPVTVVTTFQGHREWHIARHFSLTPTTTHSLTTPLTINCGSLNEIDFTPTADFPGTYSITWSCRDRVYE